MSLEALIKFRKFNYINDQQFIVMCIGFLYMKRETVEQLLADLLER